MVHEAVEAVGADEGCCAGLDEAAAAEGTAGTTTEGVLACAATTTGEGEGTAAAAGADDDEGCTTGEALDCASPEPPGTVQPMGVHSIP